LTVLDFATETWNEVGRGDGVLRALYHPSAEMLRRETAD
jgi:hypothetical protein